MPVDLDRVLAEATTHKTAGNDHFVRGETADAIACYERGIVLLAPHVDANGGATSQESTHPTAPAPAPMTPGDIGRIGGGAVLAPKGESGGGSDTGARVFDLLRALMLNVAACRLRVFDYERCEATCDAVIERDPSCAKAWYRRAKARHGMADLEGAAEDMERALELSPEDDGAIAAQLQAIKEELSREGRTTGREAKQGGRGDGDDDKSKDNDSTDRNNDGNDEEEGLEIPDDLPPLDDMEDYLVSRGIDVGAKEAEQKKRRAEAQRKRQQQKNSGLKKGFLTTPAAARQAASSSSSSSGSSSSRNSSSTSPAYTVGDRDGDAKRNPLVLDEVQDALKSSGNLADRKDEWLTPDLLGAFASNPVLMRGMANPAYKEAIDAMSKNPAAAMQRYANDPQLMEFLRAFAGAMGDHFAKIADMKEAESSQQQQPKPKGTMNQSHTGSSTTRASSAVVPLASRPSQAAGAPLSDQEAAKADALAQKPEIQALLLDPEVQAVLGLLRAGRQGPELQARLANPETGRKIHLLVQNGLLKVER